MNTKLQTRKRNIIEQLIAQGISDDALIDLAPALFATLDRADDSNNRAQQFAIAPAYDYCDKAGGTD